MKYCSKCGFEAQDDDVFCSRCGNRFVIVNEQNNYYQQNNNYRPLDESIKNKGVLSLVFGLIALFSEVVGLFLLWPLGFIALGFSIAGLVLGIKSRKLGMGVAGMVLSIVTIAAIIISVIFVMLAILAIFFPFRYL